MKIDTNIIVAIFTIVLLVVYARYSSVCLSRKLVKYQQKNMTNEQHRINISKLDIFTSTTSKSENIKSQGNEQLEVGKPTQNNKKQTGVTTICTLTPLTSRGFKGRPVHTTALKTLMLPSLEKTSEIKYEYRCFFGYDKGDEYWHKNKPHVQKHFHKHENIEVDIIMVEGGSYTKAVNEIAQYAYTHGNHSCDYFVRVNDDGEFQSSGWTTAAIQVLKTFNPPNVGAVGPVGKGTCCRIFIFDMVHRTHLDIFDTYYPSVLDNWWTDDWITQVYGKNKKFVKGWKMQHHTGHHGQRYKVNRSQVNSLNGAIQNGIKQIEKYLST